MAWVQARSRRYPSRGSGKQPPLASVVVSPMQMPRLFFWTQVLIVVFVLAGIVIAITKLA